MKVLLSNAPWYEAGENGFLGVRAGSRWPHKWAYNQDMKIEYRPFPFFMSIASAILKRDTDCEVIFRDSIESGDTYESYYAIIKDEMPDIILLETSTPSLKNDLSIASHIKEIIPNCIIVLTGLHVEIEQADFLRKYPFVDFCIYGEYEIPFSKLIKALENNDSLNTIPALLYRDKTGEIHRNDRGETPKMSKLPWPDRDSIPTDYYDGMNGLSEPQLQMHTSRGCPYHCNFCVWPQLVYGNHKYRMREPQDIIDEILANLKKVDYKSIYFDDDAININKKHVLELCRLMKENGLDKIKWGCMARGDLMDDEVLAALKDAGCYSVKYGVETFNQEILDRTGKAMNIEKNVENIRKTREKYGIKVHLTYCLGLLGDTEETVKDTIEKALELDADSRQFSIATPYPGSRLWDIYKEKGWIVTDDFDMFDGHNTSVVMHEGIDPGKLSELRRYAEESDVRQQSRKVPKEFKEPVNIDKLKETVGSGHNILIACTARRGIVEWLYKCLKEENKSVYVLTAKEWVDALEGVRKDDLLVLPRGTRISKSAIAGLTDKCKNDLNIDTFVIPTRGTGRCGYENVEEAARIITNRILMIGEDASVEVL